MGFRPIRKHEAETTDIAFRLTGGLLKFDGLPEKSLKNFNGIRGGADAIFHCSAKTPGYAGSSKKL